MSLIIAVFHPKAVLAESKTLIIDGNGTASAFTNAAGISQPKIDVIPPHIRIISPAHGEVVRSSTLTVVWEGWDDLSGINRYEFTVDQDKEWLDLGDLTTVTFSTSEEGHHTLTVRAYDNAGNMNQDTVEIVIATEAATVLLLPYLTGIFIAIVVIAVIGITLYIFRARYPLRIRKPHRKLVR